jgi:DNA excision repair protein ERCC-5
LHETGDIINDDTVFLEDLPTGVAARGAVDGTTMHRGGDEDTAAPKKKKYVHRDAYALPEMAGSIQERATLADPRMATEEELRDFIEDMRPEDFDVDSEWFNGLSTEVKYEIIGDLRIKSRQANHKRVEGMRQSATALDFSKAQIKHLMQRNDLTQKLFTVTDDISKSNTAPIRIASERNKHYVLIKNDASQGGGWALGVRDPKGTGTKDAPLQVDATTTDTDTAESHTSEAEFDPVPIPAE